MPDPLPFSNEKLKKEVGPKGYDDMCQVGPEVKKLCQKLGLKILILQLLATFEGWKKGPVEIKMQLRERKDGCGLWKA
jgi:hypothetical protein